MNEKKKSDALDIKMISAQDTWPIRHQVLRPGRPLAECDFVGDNEKTTFHLGLFDAKNLAGIATFTKDTNPQFDGEQFRLRGMAVLPEYRRKSYGKLLVEHGERVLKDKHINILWFNAREVALSFYRGLGYQAIGDPYEIDTVGIHHLMYKNL